MLSRRLLEQLLQQPGLIPEICQRLNLTVNSSTEPSSGLAAILLSIILPAWKAVEEAGRNLALRAAFVATAFMPQAFSFGSTNTSR